MIYDFKKVVVVSYTNNRDVYGQPHIEEASRREVDMNIWIAYWNNVEDVRYVDATHIGLTFDRNITDGNTIISSTGTYEVLFTIPSRRLTQVFLKKVK